VKVQSFNFLLGLELPQELGLKQIIARVYWVREPDCTRGWLVQ